MLVTLFEDVRPMALSGIASGFVAAIALIRLQQLWCLIWLCVDVGLLAARLAIARAYVVHDAAGEGRPEYWALRYARCRSPRASCSASASWAASIRPTSNSARCR
jgi:hypothetical protein